MENITTLFPGGFKPITGAHLALANRYAENPAVSQVIMLIGPKPRDGYTQEQTISAFGLLNTNPKIQMQPTPHNSPIMAAYEYLFDLPEDATGQYAMAASAKDDDYVRTKSFVPNIEKYKLTGDRKGRKIPQGIDAVELISNTDPLTYDSGEPISATSTRAAIAERDYDRWKQSYPGYSEEILKNVWQIYTGVSESVFSKEWWTNQLAEDIAQVSEGYIDAKTAEKHKNKIEKLRKFLDKNTGKEFVYDFDIYDKTAFGVPLTENYITRQELSQIESAADRFFKQYGIDVDMQGQFTHFIDRLNDPRNDAPIYIDELEDMFKELADQYGEDIASQIQTRNDSAVVSDLATDIPIHMPFMLRYDKSDDEIKLIPRTIKKQKRHWQSNNPQDVKYYIESLQEGVVLTEGGAAGHMAHPYDDHGLTFNEMKELIARALEGHLDIESEVTEKTDGQNIQVTFKDGEIGFARNKSTIVNPLTAQQLIDKFAGRGSLSDAFSETAQDLRAAFREVGPEKLNKVFKNGNVFANMEIIYPATKNIINYENAYLQFHNLVEYRIGKNDKGKSTVDKVQTDLTGGRLLQKMVEDVNMHMQNTFSFLPPQKIKIGRVEDFEDQQAALFSEVDQLKNQFNLNETDLLSDYHRAWWKNVISTAAKNTEYQIPENVIETLVDRWAFDDKSTAKPKLMKMIENEQFANWVTQIDKIDLKKLQKENMEPFENIFLRLGTTVLKNAENLLAANPTKAAREIKRDVANTIRSVQKSGNVDDLKKVEAQIKRLQKLGGPEAIVPTEGVVFTFKGNTYKLTGTFAPVNQILGMFKYSR